MTYTETQLDGRQLLLDTIPRRDADPYKLLFTLRTTVYNGTEWEFGTKTAHGPELILHHESDIRQHVAFNEPNSIEAKTVSGPGNADAAKDIHDRLLKAIEALL